MNGTGQINSSGQVQLYPVESNIEKTKREFKIENHEKHGPVVVVKETNISENKFTYEEFLRWYDTMRDSVRNLEHSISDKMIEKVKETISDVQEQIDEMAPHVEVLDSLKNKKTKEDQTEYFSSKIVEKLRQKKVNENFVKKVWKKLSPEVQNNIVNIIEQEDLDKLNLVLLKHNVIKEGFSKSKKKSEEVVQEKEPDLKEDNTSEEESSDKKGMESIAN